ncbi:hypothetical protein [Acidovorax sp. JHL-9]|uniref:hypothetical protein n=1 Tax=Acidovorax sp. JHL-9 TaxID=1276756 RepID=UPI0012DF4DD2|nr:hypothetical protein [Acidovorax sp. JHL-9]
MTHLPARLVSALALAALATGCAVVPGDPYYTPQPIGYGVYEQSTYIYGSPAAVYGYPVAPPPGYYGRRYDDRNDWRERERAQREREAHREREALRDREARREREARQAQDARREQDARRDWERNQARDQARREQAQREQVQREQHQRGVQAQRDEARRDQEPRQNRPDHPRGRSDAPRGQDN